MMIYTFAAFPAPCFKTGNEMQSPARLCAPWMTEMLSLFGLILVSEAFKWSNSHLLLIVMRKTRFCSQFLSVLTHKTVSQLCTES